jgi:hypothetical protein
VREEKIFLLEKQGGRNLPHRGIARSCHPSPLWQSVTAACHEVPHRQFVLTIPKTERSEISTGLTVPGIPRSQIPTGSIKPQHGKPPKSRSLMVAFSPWNTPDLGGIPHEKRGKNFSTKSLGKANRIGILAVEEFHHGNDFKPLSPAQIRRLEPCA